MRTHDKLLFIKSETSVGSQWVEPQVERALQKEGQTPGRTALFPIRVGDAVMEAAARWASYLRDTRHIGDLTGGITAPIDAPSSARLRGLDRIEHGKRISALSLGLEPMGNETPTGGAVSSGPHTQIEEGETATH